MDFGAALDLMRAGRKVHREGWNGKGMWIAIDDGDGQPDRVMTLPFIYMKTADDQLVPWLASQTDILATDWCILHSVPWLATLAT